MSDVVRVPGKAYRPGKGVPAWWLRVAVGLAAGGIAGVLWAADAPAFAVWTAAVLAALCVVLPASPVGLVAICFGAVVATMESAAPLSAAVLALIPLGHLLHLASGLAALLPNGARVDPRALRPTALRALLTQAFSWLGVIVATFLPTGPVHPVVEFGGLLCIAGLALGVIFLERSRSGPATRVTPAETGQRPGSHPGGGGARAR